MTIDGFAFVCPRCIDGVHDTHGTFFGALRWMHDTLMVDLDV